jgi:hypothetical protein
LSSGCGSTASLGGLLRNETGRLLSLQGDLYALESGELSRIDPERLTLLHRHIRGIAASSSISMLCTDDGRLTISRRGQPFLVTTCINNDSDSPLAVQGDHYAALTKPDELITDHGSIRLPFSMKSAFWLAMSEDGQIALVDLAGEAWLIPARGSQAERITVRVAHPTTSSAVGLLGWRGCGLRYSNPPSMDLHRATRHRHSCVDRRRPHREQCGR